MPTYNNDDGILLMSIKCLVFFPDFFYFNLIQDLKCLATSACFIFHNLRKIHKDVIQNCIKNFCHLFCSKCPTYDHIACINYNQFIPFYIISEEDRIGVLNIFIILQSYVLFKK